MLVRSALALPNILTARTGDRLRGLLLFQQLLTNWTISLPHFNTCLFLYSNEAYQQSKFTGPEFACLFQAAHLGDCTFLNTILVAEALSVEVPNRHLSFIGRAFSSRREVAHGALRAFDKTVCGRWDFAAKTKPALQILQGALLTHGAECTVSIGREIKNGNLG